MELKQEVRELAEESARASRWLAGLETPQKDAILDAWADTIDLSRDHILSENAEDLKAGKEAGLNDALLDRLRLDDSRIDGIIAAIEDVRMLPDPVGKQLSELTRPNGLKIRRVRVPIGVIAMIYESRPNVTVEAASLCFKASNAVILRGGKEAHRSNMALWKAIRQGGINWGMHKHAIELVQTTDREAVKHLVELDDFVDLVIPRGGEGLIRAVTEMSRVPVIKHYKGVCHTYVDRSADLDAAHRIAVNAKCQRPGVCNAMETLLVHQAVAAEFLPKLAQELQEKGVELRGDQATRKIVDAVLEATEQDWYEEYLDLVLSIRVVDSVDAAIDHINHYGSHHSDAVIAEDAKVQKQFLNEVDSAAVYVNASTRFTDGGEFGLGAEIGISTDKIHARGPMGLEELTTYKFVIEGSGQTRE
jgi:glutamate-5-semialdehyde dehydrogenase